MSNQPHKYAILALLFALLMGCGEKGPPSQPPATFTIFKQKVEFSPPPADWKKHTQAIAEDDKDIMAVVFEPATGKGHIAVTNEPLAPDAKGNVVELENDQDTLNKIAMAVIKREGEISNQTYIKVDGRDAYRMEFTYGNGKLEMQGIEVHFSKNGYHYALAVHAPKDEFKSYQPYFEQVVKTFKVL